MPNLKNIHRILILVFVAPISTAAENPHWAYHGEGNPAHWADLDEAYKICRSGRNQSPINITAALDTQLPELIFDYYSQDSIRETNNGHTVQVDLEPGSFLIIEERDQRFQALQMHFHSPSEHTVAGESFAMEMHIVHADESGNLAVVGILFRAGDENPVLQKIWSFMPKEAGQSVEEAIPFEESGLLPPTRGYYAYNGSLTTPPCSEGVAWIVLKDPIEASTAQLEEFQRTMGEATNRPVQPHNARTVLE